MSVRISKVYTIKISGRKWVKYKGDLILMSPLTA